MDTWKSCQNSNLFEFKGRNHGFFTFFFSQFFLLKHLGFKRLVLQLKASQRGVGCFWGLCSKEIYAGEPRQVSNIHTAHTFPFSVSISWLFDEFYWYFDIWWFCKFVLQKIVFFEILNVMFVYVFTLLKAEKLSCRIWKYQ